MPPASLTHALRRAAQINPRGLATVDADRRRLWPETAARVARLAGGLRDLGLHDGDRAALLASNSDRLFEAMFAVLWAGGVVVPLNLRWAAPELHAAIADCRPAVLLADHGVLPIARALAAELRPAPVLATCDAPEAAPDLPHHEALAAASPIDDAGRGGDDLAGIFYTGGTTGRAKGVMLSHANLLANALGNIAELGLHAAEVYLHAAPMFHLADGLATWAVSMVAGTHVFVPRFAPEAVYNAIAAHRVTFTTLVPTMVEALLDAAPAGGGALGCLRKLFYGASPMPAPVLRRAIATLPDCAIYGAYGMTELSPIATVLGPQHHTLEAAARPGNKLGSVGRATLGVELRVAGADGRELPRGAVGELQARGANVMRGYWERPQETAAALEGGWLHTGDAAAMDDEGFVYIVDRIKDMIVTGGENVYSAEVEQVLYLHPGVRQCAVIGVPDTRWGEAVHAIVVPAAGTPPTPAELIEHCRRHIAGYKCPRSVELRSEPLPVSGAGKVLKNELRTHYRTRHDRNGR